MSLTTSGGNGVSMAGPLSLASTFTENLLLEYTEGMSGDRFAWGRLDAAGLQHLMRLHTAYADLMRRTPHLARARGGNLLRAIFASLTQAVEGKPASSALGPPSTDTL